ncbi:NAD(P)H-dependent glycerol-3-phosphate dehydrogenase [Roseivirga sp. BDSF3-8]|uniref:NAD(P)H-dependent glycerol-3-phosphate dehydrogenase n=1 Tax=Roseivirga sp. BDSF3-8 TaxID=3241598 RepID=UPI003532699C
MVMTSKSMSRPIGVIGAGSFGAAVTNLLSKNSDVLIYARRQEVVDEVNETHKLGSHDFNERVKATNDLAYLAEQCHIIFPVVPSSNFRQMIRDLSPYLYPYHMLIHGTKGLDLLLPEGKSLDDLESLERECVKTMSEVIREETVVVRIGCMAGPNLAKELAHNQPAATVVASQFREVIHEGQRLLRNERFQVYGSTDLIGVELCGVLKNIIAIASGAVSGMGLGENARSLLISRGMVEMIYLGRAFGGNTQAFIGLAGVGDLVATCTSNLSRNFTVGYRLAQGESLDEVLNTMSETAEGIQTVRTVKKLIESIGMRAPITETLYKVLFEGLTVTEGLQYLMKYPFNVDIDFL